MRRALLIALAWSGIALAAEPPAGESPSRNDGPLRRELRIGADVFRSALTEHLADDRRVVEVEAGYLAGQGVLVLVELTRPWLLGPDGANPEIAHLEQIPEMVQDILSELRLGLNPRQAEDLQELREIRETQREIRAEQRELRAQIREKRRELLRADTAEAEILRREIDELNRNLTAAEDEERTLEAEAATVRDSIGAASGRAHRKSLGDLDQAVARTVCAYGATFRSPAADEHLNVVVRSASPTRYYVFRIADTRACHAGDLNSETLLQHARIRDG